MVNQNENLDINKNSVFDQEEETVKTVEIYGKKEIKGRLVAQHVKGVKNGKEYDIIAFAFEPDDLTKKGFNLNADFKTSSLIYDYAMVDVVDNK